MPRLLCDARTTCFRGRSFSAASDGCESHLGRGSRHPPGETSKRIFLEHGTRGWRSHRDPKECELTFARTKIGKLMMGLEAAEHLIDDQPSSTPRRCIRSSPVRNSISALSTAGRSHRRPMRRLIESIRGCWSCNDCGVTKKPAAVNEFRMVA